MVFNTASQGSDPTQRLREIHLPNLLNFRTLWFVVGFQRSKVTVAVEQCVVVYKGVRKRGTYVSPAPNGCMIVHD